METLRKNYEKILLAIALLALVIMAFFLYQRARQISTGLRDPKLMVRGVDAPKINPTQFDKYLDQLRQPFQWRLMPHPLFNPQNPWYRTEAGTVKEKRPLREEDRDDNKNRIPDIWERQYGLNVSTPDKSEAELDKDGDGFTNREEFLAGTDPTDPKSRPSYATKLELRDIYKEQVKIRVIGEIVIGGQRNVIFSLENGSQVFAKEGERVQDYQIISISKERDPKTGEMVVVTLQRPDENPIVLRQGGAGPQTADDIALFYFTVDSKSFEVKLGKSFSLRDDKFVVKSIDIEARKVIIKDTAGAEYALSVKSATIERNTPSP